MQLRLQKYLSEQGICSRRQAEKLIVEGKIFVNGEAATVLGTKIDPEVDKVSVNNTVIKQRTSLIYIAINKPVGIVTSCHQPDSSTLPYEWHNLQKIPENDSDVRLGTCMAHPVHFFEKIIFFVDKGVKKCQASPDSGYERKWFRQTKHRSGWGD